MNSPQGADGWDAKAHELMKWKLHSYHCERAGGCGTDSITSDIAAALRQAHAEGVRAGREQEREECAKLLDYQIDRNWGQLNQLAQTIRAGKVEAVNAYFKEWWAETHRARSARDGEG